MDRHVARYFLGGPCLSLFSIRHGRLVSVGAHAAHGAGSISLATAGVCLGTRIFARLFRAVRPGHSTIHDEQPADDHDLARRTARIFYFLPDPDAPAGKIAG